MRIYTYLYIYIYIHVYIYICRSIGLMMHDMHSSIKEAIA